ncbi:MAG: 6-carboxytetrahydropterin synthase [Candidatus Bathyarchaeota archaeon]|nr:6-carboxytetrahydropterin synthase [Candidatus Bathyarchaeota archaeon]
MKLIIEGDDLNFSSAHFLTGKDFCETLHGHNYHVRIYVDGEPLQGIIINFLTLKNAALNVCKCYDHKFLLPVLNPLLKIEEHGGYVEVKTFKGKKYVFPLEDVIKLEVEDSTCENLAKDFCLKLIDELKIKRELKMENIKTISIVIEEKPGRGVEWTSKF